MKIPPVAGVLTAVKSMLDALPMTVYWQADTATVRLAAPYAVLSLVPGGDRSGPLLQDWQTDTTFHFRLTNVAVKLADAASGADAITEAWIGDTRPALPSITGWTEQLREIVDGPDLDAEGTVNRRVFFFHQRLALTVTPS